MPLIKCEMIRLNTVLGLRSLLPFMAASRIAPNVTSPLLKLPCSRISWINSHMVTGQLIWHPFPYGVMIGPSTPDIGMLHIALRDYA